MRGMFAILKKELRTNLFSFPTFVLASLFLLASGLFFTANVIDLSTVSKQLLEHPEESFSVPVHFNQAVILPFFLNAGLIFILILPLVAARSFSEEKRQWTFELLFTYPVSDFAIVSAKFLALCAFSVLLILPTLIYFLFYYFLKFHFNFYVLGSAYLGLFLVAILLSSIGMLVSSLTESQIMSTAVSFFLFVSLWIMGWVTDLLFPQASSWVNEFWIVAHLREFSRGVIDTAALSYYLIAAAFFLFVTLLSLESRSWKR